MKTILNVAAATVLATALGALAGCGSTEDKQVGIGRGTDEYKRSPCACVRVPLLPPDPARLERLREWNASPVAHVGGREGGGGSPEPPRRA